MLYTVFRFVVMFVIFDDDIYQNREFFGQFVGCLEIRVFVMKPYCRAGGQYKSMKVKIHGRS